MTTTHDQFVIGPAVRREFKAKIAIDGPTGAGKTYTALAIARGLVGPKGKIGLVDTENRSASLYADQHTFDTIDLAPPYDPRRYTGAILALVDHGCDVIIVDSLSHAWAGTGGLLEMVDEFKKKREHGGNQFGAWREATPIQNEMVDAIIRAPVHIIVTMRSKMAYVLDTKDGKTAPRKVGMQPIQRDDLEYEFTMILDMDQGHQAEVTKTRMAKFDGRVLNKPDAELGREIAEWLSEGEAKPEAPTDRSDDATLALSQLRAWVNDKLVPIGDAFNHVLDVVESLGEPAPRDHAEIGDISDKAIVEVVRRISEAQTAQAAEVDKAGF